MSGKIIQAAKVTQLKNITCNRTAISMRYNSESRQFVEGCKCNPVSCPVIRHHPVNLHLHQPWNYTHRSVILLSHDASPTQRFWIFSLADLLSSFVCLLHVECLINVSIQSQWRIEGEIPGCHGSHLSVPFSI